MKKIILSAVCAAFCASAGYAGIHKDSCSGADTGYKTMNNACAHNPNTMVVQCTQFCAVYEYSGACKTWTYTETASAVCTSTGDKMLLRKCSDEQAAFAAKAIEKAREEAEQLSGALNALDVSVLEVETQRRFGYARRIAKSVVSWLNHDRQFLCKSSEQGLCKGNLAVAIPLTGGLAAIRLCDAFFNQPLKKAGATIIHEASHSCCATSDSEYYDSNAPLSSQNWHNIADTYYYWAMNGLCIPGETECSADAMTISESGNEAIAAGAGTIGGGGGSW